MRGSTAKRLHAYAKVINVPSRKVKRAYKWAIKDGQRLQTLSLINRILSME